MAADERLRKATAASGRPDPGQTGATARMMAPFALVVATAVVGIVIIGSVGSDEEGGGGGEQRRSRQQTPRPETYTVQPGDTVVGIAAEFDLSSAVILRCNRDLDPQNLASGQEIKLRC